MPIFIKDNIRILFIHVPKTGGSFIESLLRENGFTPHYLDSGPLNKIRRCSPQHMHADILNMLFDLNKFDFIFMTVRNPVDRFVSQFRMKRKNEPDDINIWLETMYKRYQNNPWLQDNHLRPQIDFYMNGAIVYKQEDKYDEQWIEVFKKDSGICLDLDPVNKIILDLANKATQGNNTIKTNLLNRDFLATDTADMVKHRLNNQSLATLQNWYKKDFVKFGY